MINTPIIREMKIKVIVRYYYTSNRITRSVTPKIGKDVKQLNSLHIVSGVRNGTTTLGRGVAVTPKPQMNFWCAKTYDTINELKNFPEVVFIKENFAWFNNRTTGGERRKERRIKKIMTI